MDKKTVGIVGLGLIGGSLAKAIRRTQHYRIYGFDVDATTLDSALGDKTIEGTLDDEIISRCDMILLALLPHSIISWVRKYADIIAPHTIIIDCAGVKHIISENLGQFCQEKNLTFIPGHPMAGYHKGGYRNSTEDLFNGASMILCADQHTDEKAIREISPFFLEIGFGRITISDSLFHDDLIAYTSQLAHIASNAFVKDELSLAHSGFSAGSFQDLTRVAVLDAGMWSELFMNNRKNLIRHIDGLADRLKQYSNALKNEDAQLLRELLEQGSLAKKRSLKVT